MARTPEQLVRHADAQKRYRLNNPEKVKQIAKAQYLKRVHTPESRARAVQVALRYKASHPQYQTRQRELQTALTSKYRQAVLDTLGCFCNRCGFADVRALQIDHVKGGGHKERSSASGYTYYKRILANSDLKALYQVLCANCNWIKRHENDETKARRHPASQLQA